MSRKATDYISINFTNSTSTEVYELMKTLTHHALIALIPLLPLLEIQPVPYSGEQIEFVFFTNFFVT